MADTNQVPTRYTGPQAWLGPDMANRPEEWLHHWTPDEIAEIGMAADSVADQDILDITARDFLLPTIKATLTDIKSDILQGRGFSMLRGLPVDEWSMDKTARVYWGLGVHMGLPISQNAKGHALGHVKNIQRDLKKATSRGYQRTDRLAFHTDTADIVGLFCRKPAKSGGDSLIVSSTSLYNEVARRRPDLAAVLMQPLQRSFVSDNPDDKNRLVDVPLFMPEDGRMIGHYVRGHIHKAQALPGVRPFSDEQKEAMALVDSIADDPAFFLDMQFRLGDIQFLCNHTILHSRRAFKDFEDFGERRHLLRLWLACKDGPALPHWMIDAYDSGRANGRQDGYHRRTIPLKVPLEAE
jgi:hypothetical protein